ncbi:energy transducer TonB [Paraburkholderia sp.]|uniref:energy transducer TonB n=1 Tax=Paraburkholderia sp. TaxID=1926495 RepID=UPI002391E953|nr:energy transducer TonB [Paraburkholderia sp.]MDE1184492.1 TonB family protein [Paraburkholderia sp.]
MQASQSVTAGGPPAPSRSSNSRVVVATVAVAALHVALLAVLLTLRHEPAQPVALESRAITAQLLPPTPVAAPVALQSTATPPPKPTPPVQKPKVQPKPHIKPTPTPLPQAAAPSPNEISSPEPTPPAPPAPPVPAAPAAPAAPARPTMDISAPKNVSHLDCKIVEPEYPAISNRRGEAGTAYVHFVVGLTGKIESIDLKKSSGYSRLDDAAMDALRASTCKPYLENGQPIRAQFTQPYEFSPRN